MPGPARARVNAAVQKEAATPTATPRRSTTKARGRGMNAMSGSDTSGRNAAASAMTTAKATAFPASLTAGVLKVLMDGSAACYRLL